MYDLMLDMLILVLLLIGIGYIVILDHRFSRVKAVHRELTCLIDQFSQITSQTQEKISLLKEEEVKAQNELSYQVTSYLQIKNELNQLLEKIDKKILSLNTTQARFMASQLQPNEKAEPNEEGEPAIISQSEKELLTALSELK